MKTINIYKLTQVKFIVLILLLSTFSTFAYPPDNAAVLYYKAALLYQPDDQIKEKLADLSKGKIKLDEQIRQHVSKNQNIIDIVLDAAQVRNCDWGIDFSEGFSSELPPLGAVKRLGRLVGADAMVQAADGDFQLALQRCISIQEIARHTNDKLLVCYLVALSLNSMAEDCILDIIRCMPENVEMVKWLKGNSAQLDGNFSLLKAAVQGECDMAESDMWLDRKPQILKFLSDCNIPESALEYIRSGDEEFFAKNRKYYQGYMADVKATLELNLPYEQIFGKLNQITPERIENDDIENPDTILACIFTPSLTGCYNVAVSRATHSNAFRAAIDIYIIKAETGRLPDSLPAGLPKDLFSGKDFQYEKTVDGFALRCQGKDLREDKIHEYEFKVKK